MEIKKFKGIVAKIEAIIDIFELVPSVVFYYVFFVLFYLVILFFKLPAKSLMSAASPFSWLTIEYLIIAMASMIYGSLVMSKVDIAKFIKPTRAFLTKGWSSRRGYIVVAILSVVDLAMKVALILNSSFFYSHLDPLFAKSNFYSTVAFFYSTGIIALAIAYAFYFKLLKSNNTKVRIWRWLAWSLFAFELVCGFLRSSRAEALMPIFIYLIVRHYLWKRDYKLTFVCFFVSLAVIMPLIHFYSFYAVDLKGFHWYFSEGMTPANITGFSLDSSVGRIQQYSIFYNIFEKSSPMWQGRYFSQFFVSLGPPKFIWHSKPTINIDTNAFAREFGIVTPNDRQTTVGATLVGDWYLNFGLAGVVLGMFVTGMVLRFIYFYLVRFTQSSLSGVMVYSVIWLQMIRGLEGWIAPLAAGMVKMIIFLLIIQWLLSSKKGETV